MINYKFSIKHVLLSCLMLAGFTTQFAYADTTYSEDFTGQSTTNNWYFFNGACLTAGTSTTAPDSSKAGSPPSCISILSSYYGAQKDGDPYLVGGVSGYLGSSTAPSSPSLQKPDPDGQGALRFTNGYNKGHNENGAIVSSTPFSASQGVQIAFKTVTYRGDSGGSGGDGADGISFYLMDASNPAGIGAWGGSLGYTCSNANPPYNGLVGAYLGLGIDEYGNFLNQGDNTASGYGYKPGRIGLRGAGSVSWSALTAAYSADPSNSSMPYYPASLATTCDSGNYDAVSGTCPICSSGTYNSVTGQCMSCSSGYVYDSSSNSCTGGTPTYCAVGTYFGGSCNSCATGTFYNGSCDSCPSGTFYNGTCNTCNSGYTFQTSGGHAGQCKKNSSNTYVASNTSSPNATSPSTTSPTNPPPSGNSTSGYGTLYSVKATQKTCSSGKLWNYSTPSSPTSAGATSLTNTANTAKILDYGVIPNAYQVLSGVKIANESATTRSQADVIFYNLKITQSGLLSLSYSINGGAYQQVIKSQDITASNGPLPSSLLFGFAGSTGGSTNVHEIMCFKAAQNTQSGSSTAVNTKQSAKVEAGTQAYFAFYNPGSWTGSVTANSITDNNGSVTVATTANWDASCNLTGVSTGNTCSSTGAGPSSAQSPSSRVMLTWNGSQGIPFEWNNLTTTEQNILNDDSHGSARVDFLRGDRSNELDSSGSGLFRIRDGILGDIVDSSPVWVGPPSAPYTTVWRDALNPGASMPENTNKTYQDFVTTNQTRLNVVYTGANDGFVHGFRAGSFDSNGNFVNNTTTPNDGQEVLAYMPGAILNDVVPSSVTASNNCPNPGTTTQTYGQNIHGVTPAIGASTACTNASLDYSNPQYGHNFFVDAAPGTGDIHYGGAWHTWVVGGLGSGGAAIYALDVTDPTKFSEKTANAAAVVIGEWTPADINCVGDGATSCGVNLGNTYGTPVIRRLHNGDWGVIFGNGFGSSTGDAGIYIMDVNQSTGISSFYYLSTGTAGNNGIAYVTPADLDGDHIADYVYAGDLQGNVWRFDLTNKDPTKWAASSSALFTTPSNQPITTQILSVFTYLNGQTYMVLDFGTGQRTQLTNTTATSYASGQQSLYGIWDWDMSGWNAQTKGTQYASLAGPVSITTSNLQLQTFTINTTNQDRDGENNPICWAGTSGCTGTSAQYGWYAPLPGVSGSTYEQIVYNPTIVKGAFTVNSLIPADNQPTSCSINNDKGVTYAVNAATGGIIPGVFPNDGDPSVVGVETDASGTSFSVTTAEGTTYLIFQTSHSNTNPNSGCNPDDPLSCKFNPTSNVSVKRLGWIERR
ncbi:MAG TPA: PilC/PilY family type IV pilus protein [Steroidobacteraceae bacterium]|nr:PilC/PilY family type IV pilus protein [Steroidobacteraceae bacterium]